MAGTYRNQMTPGLKKCIDHMRGKGKKEYKEGGEVGSDTPPNYTMPKINK